LAAYDLTTGGVAWKVERLNGITGGYSTPAILAPTDKSDDAGSRIVVAGPMKLVVYNVATGNSELAVPGVTNAPVSLPVIVGQRVFLCEPLGEAPPFSMLDPFDADKDGKFTLKEVASNVPISRLLQEIDKKHGNGDGIVDADEWDKTWAGFLDKGGLTAVDLAGTVSTPVERIKWNYRRTVPYIASVLVYENVLYFLQDGGIVTTLDSDKGKVLKRGRIDGGRGKFYASPVAGDGKIFLVNTDGQLTVLKAGAEWEQLSSQPLGEPCFATPAVCNGRVYVRTAKSLFCFGKRN
jgi:outer membrane protein assembly factor BamB